MHVALTRQEHRPWPIPERPWTWRQNWHDLLFAHWPISASALRARIPAQLEIDEFDGTAWVGVVPFRMSGVMRRPWPNVPWISAFPELNVRTYVKFEGRPGVWFLSLDASNPFAVWAARRFFHLPYHRASMSLVREKEQIRYVSSRRDASLAMSYAPTSDPRESVSGTLEHWLTERYCLYARAPDGGLWCNEVHHHPWPLQQARASFDRNTMLRVHGLDVSGPPPQLHFARRLDVVVWGGERLGE